MQSLKHDLALPVLFLLFGFFTAVAIEEYVHHSGNFPTPKGPVDPRFVAVGRAYAGQLGKAYASAIVAGAADLDAGKPVSDAIKAIGQGWDRNRQALFDHVLAPELDKIVPESTKDADVTASQRAALVSALRGLAEGLNR